MGNNRIKPFKVGICTALCLVAFTPAWSQMVMEDLTKGRVDQRKNATSFSKALECKNKEDVQGAIANFEEALRYMPDDAASMYELSYQYGKVGRVQEAFDMIRQAAQIDPDNKWYQMRLAQFYKSQEQYGELIAIFEKLSDRYPEDLDMLSQLIEALLYDEQYDKAITKLNLLEEQYGRNSLISEQRMEIYKRQGKTKNVIAELQKMIADDPLNSRNYSMLAQVYMENGDEKEAMKMYEKVKETNPDDPYINVSLLEYYEKSGDNDKAFNELIEAIRNPNLDFNTKANIYEYWFKKSLNSPKIDEQALQAGNAFLAAYPDNKMGYLILGSYHINKKNPTEARQMFAKVLQCDSSDYVGWQNLVLIEAEMDDTEAVLQHSKEALKYHPMQPVFYWFAGSASAMKKQNEEAITFLEKGRRFVADKILLTNFDSYLGDLYYQTGQEEKAFDAYEKVLRANPDNALVLNNFAYYLSLKSEQLDRAFEMSSHAVELEPDNATFIDTRAWVLYKQKRYRDAEKQMKKAIDLVKSPEGLYFEHYGDILFRLDKKEEALEYWNKALKTGNYSDKLEQKVAEGKLYE